MQAVLTINCKPTLPVGLIYKAQRPYIHMQYIPWPAIISHSQTALIIGTLIGAWHIIWSGYVRLGQQYVYDYLMNMNMHIYEVSLVMAFINFVAEI